MEATEILDKSQMPPLHQKRILAFVNHFLISSCTFLNEFATKCDSKFIQLERKMQKVEAALTIIEAKLASIPDSDLNVVVSSKEDVAAAKSLPAAPPHKEDEVVDTAEEAPPIERRACDDVRFAKFFKMLHFGVPAEAVKIKMQAEGIEPSILDAPNLPLSETSSS